MCCVNSMTGMSSSDNFKNDSFLFELSQSFSVGLTPDLISDSGLHFKSSQARVLQFPFPNTELHKKVHRKSIGC